MREPRRRRVAEAALVLTLVLAAVASYGPALTAGWIWDDDDYVTHNDTLRDLDGLRRIWFEVGATPQYYPLVHTTFWLEYRLWGLEPAGYHTVNVLLHALNALLLWRLLRRLGVPGAWWAGLLFALHPVHVESVAWVTERKNVLSGVFYLGAATAFLAMGEQRDTRQRMTRYALSLILFLAALLSKTVTATLPAALLVVLWWQRRWPAWRESLLTLPMFVAGAAMGLLTVWMERAHVGAVGTDWSLSLAERALVAGRAVWFYLEKLAWPHPLMFVYPRWTIDPGSARQVLMTLAALALPIVLWLLSRRLGRAPLAAYLFFVLTLSPALGFLNVYPMRFSFVADHFQYLASIGPIALAVGFAARAARDAGERGAAAFATAGTGCCLLLAVLTFQQARIYEDEETLWRETLKRNPQAAIAHNNLGAMLLERGELAPAEVHLREAALIDYPEAHNNLGILLSRLGREAEAVERYREALRLRPGFADAHVNLGVSLASAGRFEQAAAEFERALETAPQLVSALHNLGLVRLVQGRPAEAARLLAEASRLAPDDDAVRQALRRALAAVPSAGGPRP